MPRVETLWNGWRQERLELPFPDQWTVEQYSLPAAVRPLSPGRIHELARSAMAELDLATLRRANRPACLLVDDITRPCSWREIVPAVLDCLNAAGWPDSQIQVLVSLAGHTPMSSEEVEAKIGAAAARRVAVHMHRFDGPFAWFDYRNSRTGLNQIFCDAAPRILLGSVLPHPFAGFSGGGKAIMPGIADKESIRRNHSLLSFGKGRVGDTNNEIRRQIDAIAALAPPHLAFQAVCDGQLRYVCLEAGPLDRSFAAALEFARVYCACRPRGGHNVVVLNCFPKDEELLQVTNALNVVRTMNTGALAGCRAVVLLGSAAKGLGFHALFGPGGPLFRPPKPLAFLKGAPLIGFFPGADAAQFHTVFSPDSCFAPSWEAVLERLQALQLERYDVAFFQQAALQICT